MAIVGAIILVVLFAIGPVFTIINIYKVLDMQSDKTVFDIFTFIIGFILSVILYAFALDDAVPYHQPAVYGSLHEPIFIESLLTIFVFLFIGVISYFCLKFTLMSDNPNLPPLVIVLCISGVYLGIITSVVMIIQLSENIGEDFLFLLLLLPFNYIIYAVSIVLRISRIKADEYRDVEYKSKFLNRCNKILCNSSRWRTIAFFIFFPLLGVIVMILTLFGQQPDSMITAFTHTSDWYFSTKISPPSRPYDGHYLCTVAAGGHKNVVKPVRLGERGGRQIIVNRQLCVANAFEQIIEERTPRIHRIVRTAYDRYGFPLSNYIRTPIAADIIYIIMKPLEYLFVVVLYLFDAAPEKRISRQYLPKAMR